MGLRGTIKIQASSPNRAGPARQYYSGQSSTLPAPPPNRLLQDREPTELLANAPVPERPPEHAFRNPYQVSAARPKSYRRSPLHTELRRTLPAPLGRRRPAKLPWRPLRQTYWASEYLSAVFPQFQ